MIDDRRSSWNESVQWHVEDEVPTTKTTTITYLLFVVFGAGSWVTVNGLFSELPLLVTKQPEGWRLASVLAIVVQLANIGPLVFYVIRLLTLRLGNAESEKRLAVLSTYGVLAIGALSMSLLACTWWMVVDIAGNEHSVPLFIFSFLAAFADCTSSLLFWRFAGSFRAVYISALSAGEGMSGVVASLLTLVQDVSSETPRFSADVYFLLLAVSLGISGLAFHALRRCRICVVERSVRSCRPTHEVSLQPSCRDQPNSAGSLVAAPAATPLIPESPSAKVADKQWLLALQALLNALQNGVAVSCLALAAKPYGPVSYQWAQTASLVLDPLAAATGHYIHLSSRALIPVAAFITLAHAYILGLSLQCVSPPLLHAGGGALLVVLATAGRAATAYSKMRCNVLLQRVPEEAEVNLMQSGIAMQCGAFVGSLVCFVLINFTTLFRTGY